MKYNELIERYVYAVSRQLPIKQRADIEKELTSIINDMLEERCGDVTPTEHDVNVVLAELGKPSELAAKYDPDGERSLIGPHYFRRYIQTMKLALPMVVLGMIIAAVLSILVEGIDKNMNIVVNGVDFSWLGVILSWVGNIITSVITAAAFITFIFAIFEYKEVTLDEDDINKLPKVPEKSHRIKRSECIVGIVFSVIFMAIIMLAPEVICAANMSDDGLINATPIFDTAVIRSLWPCFATIFVLGIGRECFGLVEGVYSMRYAVVTVIVNVLIAVGVVFAFGRSSVMNSEFLTSIDTIFKMEPDAEFLTVLFEKFNIFLVGVWLFALVLDTVEAIVKFIKYKNDQEN